MAFIPVPNTVKVTLEWLIAGQVVAITLSFSKAAAPTVPDMTQLLTDLDGWRNFNLRPIYNAAAVAQRWTATDQSSAFAPSVELPITLNPAGSGTGQASPNNASLTCTFITPNRGRSFRGRVYMPGIGVNTQISPVEVSGTYAGNYTAAMAALNTAISGGPYVHTVASRYNGGAPRITGIATPVTAYRTETFLDAQRRRLAKRGQ